MNTSAADQPVSPYLRLARHLVGLWIAAIPVSWLFAREFDLIAWVAIGVVCVVVGAVVTALAALFFTKSQARKSLHNFIITTWAALGLMVFGMVMKPPKPGAKIYEKVQVPVAAPAQPQPADNWRERQRLVVEQYRAGHIPAHIGALRALPGDSIYLDLPADATQAMESKQSWWVEPDKKTARIYLVNSTLYELAAVEYSYSPGLCSGRTSASRNTLLIDPPIPHVTAGVVSFDHGGSIGGGDVGCLVIERSWTR